MRPEGPWFKLFVGRAPSRPADQAFDDALDSGHEPSQIRPEIRRE